MKRAIFLSLLFFAVVVNAQYLDDDMDGVENEDDLCPNSAITDIVDERGCVIEKVDFKSGHHFDITLGYKYARLDEEYSQTSQSLSLGYYYENFSAYFYTSNYDLNSGESGADDSSLSFYYRIENGKFRYRFGVGVYIPTYDSADNKTDYFTRAKVIYYRDNFDFSFSLGHTFMQDIDSVDTNSFTIGVGYMVTQKRYISLSYKNQDSIYANEENLQDLSFYVNYLFNEHVFLSTQLSAGLSKSSADFSATVNIGYYF